MLLLATFLQQLEPQLCKDLVSFSEPPHALMKRLVDLAVSLVTTNDDLLGSIEGLQCIMVEGLYLANGGSLRRSWISVWRALSIAQLLGIDRRGSAAQHMILDPRTTYEPSHMWFRMSV